MIQQYRFMPPQRVVSGCGAVDGLAKMVEGLGKKRAFILTGSSLATKTDLVERVQALLGDTWVGTFAGCRQHVLSSSVDEATAEARKAQADVIVSFGGGSPTDTAKNVAYRLLGDAPREDMPQITIPTTLSAGEFTPHAGMTDEATRIKAGVRDPRILPSVVILDPELTVETPQQLWASTGIKALDHAVEALWSPRAHPITDTLALEAIRRLTRHLKNSVDPSNLDDRLECQLGAWMSIFGVVNVGMRLSHPLGHQIGARWNVPHGITSCVVLPQVMRYLESSAADALTKVGHVFDETLAPAEGVSVADRTAAFIQSLGLPARLSEVGALQEELPDVAQAIADELDRARSPDAGTATKEIILELLESVW